MGTVTQQFVYLFSYKLIWYYFAFLSISIDLFLKKNNLLCFFYFFPSSMNKESMPQDITCPNPMSMKKRASWSKVYMGVMVLGRKKKNSVIHLGYCGSCFLKILNIELVVDSF
jgi:hypothetical protein